MKLVTLLMLAFLSPFVLAETQLKAMTNYSFEESEDKDITSKAQKLKTNSLFCMQTTPNTVWGYVIEDAEVELSSEMPRIKINSMGIGIISQDGDGSVSEVLFSPEKYQEPDYSEKSKSAKWKDAVPFVLNSKVKPETKYVLYIDAKAFEGPQEENFAGRLKVSEGTKVRNYTMYCVHN